MPEIVAQPENPQPVIPPSLSESRPAELPKPKQLLRRAKEVARGLQKFLKENPSQRVIIDGKKYPCREAWQFVSHCYGHTAMITKTESLLSDDNVPEGFIAIAHVLNERGRVVSGAEAACMFAEADWAGKPAFQLRSMASTRACSKAMCNVFAFVMVIAGLCPTPAEEMGPQASDQRKRKQFRTQCEVSSCPNMISDKRRAETRKKYGKALCVECEKKHAQKESEKIAAPLNDPKQVAEFIEKAKRRKALLAQPVVNEIDRPAKDEVVGA